jgi:hypothetical protein
LPVSLSSIFIYPTTHIPIAVALVHFFRRRVSFSQHLKNSNSALTTSRYFRLMLMALVEMFWGILVTACNMWFTCQDGMRPWTGWANVHWNFSRIALYPTVVIPIYDLTWTYALWWTIPISALIFSAFFSFGEDAMKEYATCVTWARSKILRQKRTQDSSGPGFSSGWYALFHSISFFLTPLPSSPTTPRTPLPPYSSSPSTFVKSKFDDDLISLSGPLKPRTNVFDDTSHDDSALVYADTNSKSLPYIIDMAKLFPYSSPVGDMA